MTCKKGNFVTDKKVNQIIVLFEDNTVQRKDLQKHLFFIALESNVVGYLRQYQYCIVPIYGDFFEQVLFVFDADNSILLFIVHADKPPFS